MEIGRQRGAQGFECGDVAVGRVVQLDEAQPQDLLVQIHKGRGLLLAFVGCAVFWVLVFLLIGGV